MRTGEIQITNKAAEVIIDIEGIIGIPEGWQFDSPDERVATYDRFKQRVGQIREIKTPRITVNIRSIGGSVNDALLIHDTLIGLNAAVTTICYGYVASAATIIAQAASVGNRRISENSLYLIHQASSVAAGNTNDMAEVMETVRKTDDLIANLYARRSGRSAEEFVSLMSENNGNGKWLTPAEAREDGLVDEVIQSPTLTNLETSAIRILNLPSVPDEKQIILKSNQSNMKTTIKGTWKGLFNFFKPAQDMEVEITDEALERINNDLESKDKAVGDLTESIKGKDSEIGNLKQTVSGKDTEIETLNARLAEVQAENDKLRAKPTQTEDREDPPHQEEKRVGNIASYDEDIKNFK